MKRPQYYWGVLNNHQFYITDSKFNVLEEIPAFTDKGNFVREVYELVAKYKFKKDWLSELRTEATIQELKDSVEQTEGLVKKYLARKGK